MKKTKIIIPALGMLLLSTAASVTGTVAWFSMNNFVNATQMKVTAKAENGIVISNQAAASTTVGVWSETATAAYTSALEVYPTSTADASAWYHSKSTDANQANTNQPYETLTIATDGVSGPGYVENGSNTQFDAGTDDAYFLKNTFYIKSSAASAITGATLYINSVSASLPDNQASANSEDLNKALRVLIKVAGTEAADYQTAKVFAPIQGASTEYGVYNGTATKTTVTPNAYNAANVSFLTNQTIPASTGTPLAVEIYVYYEGEDANCKSANLTATLDQLEVAVQFGTIQAQP